MDKSKLFRSKRKQRKENEAIEESRVVRRLEKLLFHGPPLASKQRRGKRTDIEEGEPEMLPTSKGTFDRCHGRTLP